ncbi:MAG: phosphoribosylaminoimidazolesuccinocarboxamide synthase [Candidatus Heimdallarchaeaceae archaeon]
MKLLYVGKTKDVFEIEEKDGIGYVGKFVMHFKDSATGYIVDKGKPTERVVFDSGYDTVVGEIPGKGIVDRQSTEYFFSLLGKKDIPTHFIEGLDERRIIVEPAVLFSLENEAEEFEGSANLHNLEVVFRRNYYGSLWRRHPHKKPGSSLNNLVEIYSKGLPNEPDILMRDDTLIELGIMKPKEIEEVKTMTKRVADILSEEFTRRNLHLIDGKIEVGKRKSDGKIMVIDEISTSVFRTCKGFVPDEKGNCTVYKDCIKTDYKDGKRTIIAKNLLNADQIAEVFGFKYDPKR